MNLSLAGSWKFLHGLGSSSKTRNLILLVLSFGLGQGAQFSATTYLYWMGHYELIAEFGTANALTTFIFFVADWGGALYLAKEVVAPSMNRPSAIGIYVCLSQFRVAAAAVFAGAFYIYALSQPATFFNEYLKYASLGMLCHGFNAVGLLDGAGRSGISGLTQAIPIAGVAIALPICSGLDMLTAGRALGALFAACICLSVSFQVIAAQIRWRSAVRELSPQHVISIATASLPYMLTTLPGHLLFRVQVLLAAQLLPAGLVALFLYCRQLIGIGYQALGFYLRVDIRDFAEDLRRKKWTPTAMLLASTAVRLGALGTITVAASSLALFRSSPSLALGLAAYSPCIIGIAAAATLQRALILRSKAAETTIILVIANVVPVLLIYPVFSTNSIYSLILIEFTSLILQSALFISRSWRRGLA
ncbi:hypothetical protein FXV83_39285 [Bradyrhizobium hipponense]|uniref:O-antigen/teichoic acid export membrane protein n=1 Tax=Bradyrhizobium hipponense TaxID=2605638 RepID=A0A5S4Y9X1_9BRAD|nr:hypothetical protein [Bradyrhizobium hipponense]TYO61221.1 hypothetical protein FXV83_39285 [Bradyrhizobium hipponense]